MLSTSAAIMMSIGLLLSSPIAGFALLKSYDDFCKGINQNNRLKIWSALFGSSFIFIILSSSITRIVMKGPDKSISGYLLIICVAFPLIASCAGFALLKAHEIFQNGLAHKSRIHIWLSFLIASAVFTLTLFATTKLVTI